MVCVYKTTTLSSIGSIAALLLLRAKPSNVQRGVDIIYHTITTPMVSTKRGNDVVDFYIFVSCSMGFIGGKIGGKSSK
jgi:hypothetical protein